MKNDEGYALYEALQDQANGEEAHAGDPLNRPLTATEAMMRSAGPSRHASIPPLSQSRYEDMACESLYAARHILKLPRAESEAAARGTIFHDLAANYVNHLVQTKQQTDCAYLDALAEKAPMDVLEVIEHFRESYVFNPEEVLATEYYIALDEDWKPAVMAGDIAYEGTLDVVRMPSPAKAKIDDWKTYFQIIDADTAQSKLYPLLLMALNPAIEEVEFILHFPRYAASRSVTYTRDDVPRLKRWAEAQHGRQTPIHRKIGGKFAATPGRHCTWCPLLAAGCPIKQTNPYATMSGEDRVAFAIWLKEAQKENTRVLKDMMAEGGPISYRDANGTLYTAQFAATMRKSYPLREGSEVLSKWMADHPGDAEFTDRLTISGLSSPLKAKKRAELAEKMSAIAEERCVTKIKIGRPGEKEENDGWDE